MKLPKITGKELARAIEKIGFVLIHVKGSHMIYRHPDGRKTSIPHHTGEELGPGLLNKIMKKELKINREQLKRLLK